MLWMCSIEIFNGPLLSLDIKGDILVCCGLAQRHGS
jgi:hypothetical protein